MSTFTGRVAERMKGFFMQRRDFLKQAAGVAGLMASGGILSGAVSGCAGGRQLVRPGVTPLDQMLDTQQMRFLWVAPHPDDESMVGAVLAKAALKMKNPLYMLVLTHGDGGECGLPEGCHPDVATVRGREMAEVARLYGAELQHEHYWNAPLPTESFPKRHDLAQRWCDETGDPTVLIAKTIRDFKPDVLLTFEPFHGFTGHPEHQLTSRFATAAVRLAADRTAGLKGNSHLVPHVYFGLNKYWPTRLAGATDKLSYTEVFAVQQPCFEGKTCAQIMGEYTLPHRTQHNDMGTVRLLTKYLLQAYLHRTAPFTEIYDPFEPVARGGMI